MSLDISPQRGAKYEKNAPAGAKFPKEAKKWGRFFVPAADEILWKKMIDSGTSSGIFKMIYEHSIG